MNDKAHIFIFGDIPRSLVASQRHASWLKAVESFVSQWVSLKVVNSPALVSSYPNYYHENSLLYLRSDSDLGSGPIDLLEAAVAA